MERHEENKTFWYAVRTFYCKEESVAKYLKKHDIEYFIPSIYKIIVTPDGKKQKKLVPAIHNLLFVKKTRDEEEIKKVIDNCPISVSVIKNKATKLYYNIPDNQMTELRAICDPNYKNTLYVDSAFAEARKGDKVKVIRGTFKGLTGKLTRYKNRTYVVITLADLGVMIHVPKWYCEKCEPDEEQTTPGTAKNK